MPETPTLKTIKNIAAGDNEFEKKLLEIIRRELPLEIEQFNENFESSNYVKVAENVHKLNHKINIFGLEEGSRKAVQFEHELRSGKSEMKSEFDIILKKMTQFLNTIT